MSTTLKIWLWFLSVINGMQCLMIDLLRSRYSIPWVLFWLPAVRLAGIYLILFKRKKSGLYVQCIAYVIDAGLYSLLPERNFFFELLRPMPVLFITWLLMRKSWKYFE